MSPVLSIPLFLASLLAWNRVRAYLTPGNHLDFRPLFRHDPIFSFAHWLDALNITEMNFIMDTLIAGLFLVALGYLFDTMLRNRGFGPFGNALLLLLGAALGAWGWSVWAPLLHRGRIPEDALAAAVGAGALLVVAALVRHLILSSLDDLGSGASARPVRGKPQGRTAQDVLKRAARQR